MIAWLTEQLDVCNNDRHFSTIAVERAPTCPLILYACLAISARHLSHTTNSVPSEVADEYHERCIAILLPGLENRDFNTSLEILLASTVILRFFEQISCAYCYEILLTETHSCSPYPIERFTSTPPSRIGLY